MINDIYESERVHNQIIISQKKGVNIPDKVFNKVMYQININNKKTKW